jgi:hypothetical protein
MPPPQALSELLRTFVQEAAVVLSEDQQANPLPVGAGETWERGGDGYFRRVVSSTPEWSWVVVRRWDQVQKLPAYVQASEALVSDHKVGPQMDKLVGAVGLSCQTIEIDHILRSCIETAVTSEGRFSFDLPRFETRWSQIWNTLSSDTLPCVLVAPLPGFSAPNLPVKLDPDLVIDKFIDDEVRQCTAVGLLPVSPLFPIIRPEDTVGIRWTAVVRKVVSDEWSAAQSKPKDVGVFGRRPVRSSSRLADDVLVALRLLKAGSVSSPGTAHSCRAWMLEGGIQFSHRPGREFQFGDYTLNEEEVVELQRLWKTLTSGVLESKRFRFLEAGLRRFNFAFERFASEDRLVDLLIAAESLFLHDGAVPQERGELRFRLALRASSSSSTRHTRSARRIRLCGTLTMRGARSCMEAR